MAELKKKYVELFGEDSTDEDEVVKEINNFLHVTIPSGPAVPQQRSAGRGQWQALAVQRNPETKQLGSTTSGMTMDTNTGNTVQRRPTKDISDPMEGMSVSSGSRAVSPITMSPDEASSERISPSSPPFEERIESSNGMETDEENVLSAIQVDELFPEAGNSVREWEAAYEEMDQALQRQMKAFAEEHRIDPTKVIQKPEIDWKLVPIEVPYVPTTKSDLRQRAEAIRHIRRLPRIIPLEPLDFGYTQPSTSRGQVNLGGHNNFQSSRNGYPYSGGTNKQSIQGARNGTTRTRKKYLEMINGQWMQVKVNIHGYKTMKPTDKRPKKKRKM